MLLVREVMFCKPGKVRPMLDKSLAIAKLMTKSKMGSMRVMTDVCAERFWTLVMEIEVPTMKAFEEMMEGPKDDPEAMKEFETIMKGYHDLVEHGRREIYKIEG